MLKSFNGLTEQLFEKPFKKMLYSIYNLAEEEMYISQLKNAGYKCDVDDVEYALLDADGISDGEMAQFKKYIEDEVQKGRPLVCILLYKSKKGVLPVVVKLISLNIEEIIHG